MKVKTADLIGPALDWAVAKCEGAVPLISWDKRLYGAIGDTFDYSTDWAQGGPIIERKHLSIEAWSAPNDEGVECFWYSTEDKFDAETWDGPTPLIAAMRCYVASKLGDEIEIPEELK